MFHLCVVGRIRRLHRRERVGVVLSQRDAKRYGECPSRLRCRFLTLCVGGGENRFQSGSVVSQHHQQSLITAGEGLNVGSGGRQDATARPRCFL